MDGNDERNLLDDINDVESMSSFCSDKYKKHERDSVDTIELIKDSTDDLGQSSDIHQVGASQDAAALEDQSLLSKSEENFEGNNLEDEQEPEQYQDIVPSSNSSRSETPKNETPEAPKEEDSKVYPSQNLQSQLEIYVPSQNEQTSYEAIGDDKIETADLMHLEPKLRDAWIKMRKLDVLLANVCKREKLVKRETIALIEKNRAELELLKLTTNHKESKSEAQNTASFLALTYIDPDDEDFAKEYMEASERMTPLFKTQIPEGDETASNSGQNESSSASSVYEMNVKEEPSKEKEEMLNPPKTQQTASSSNTSSFKFSTFSTKEGSLKSGTGSKASKAPSQAQSTASKPSKDFIKRNINLAQDPHGRWAMTDQEKQRLNELLLDFENSNENSKKRNIEITESDHNSRSYLVEYNPFAVQLTDGEGFTPERIENDRLRQIDYELDKRNNSRQTMTTSVACMSAYAPSLMNGGPNEHQSAVSSQYNIDAEKYSGVLQLEVKQIKLNDEFDENELGDKFIREARVNREQEIRLKQIDTQLKRLKATHVNDAQSENYQSSTSSTTKFADSEVPSVSSVSLINEDQLRLVLKECESECAALSNMYLNSNKLQTLEEEIDSEDYDQVNEGSVNERPTISQNMINILLEQARNEGVVDLSGMTDSRNRKSSPTRSFYEEALEIISSSRQQYQDSLADDDGAYQLDDDQKPDAEASHSRRDSLVEGQLRTPTQQSIRPSSSSFYPKNSRNSTPTFMSNFDAVPARNSDLNGNRTVLPPIERSASRSRPQSNMENEPNEQANSRDDSSRHSASSSTFGSITILPKIDNRFLNKK